jgi:5-methyltetrahydropteroyltriglutamate--homocysteine methyltransferase
VEVHAGLTGPFPRDETLVRATREFDRRRIGPESLEAAYAEAEEAVTSLEREAGFATVTGGYLRWPDLLRPFAESWEGFTIGPLTRWFETNTFFRQPVLQGPPLRRAGAFVRHLPPPVASDLAHARVLLPGPYTFAGLVENRSGETNEALVHRLGRLLADEVAEVWEQGGRDFLFLEPLLVSEPPKGPRAEAVVAAYRMVGTSARDARTTVWTYGNDAVPAMDTLDRLPVSVIGVDLAWTDPAHLAASPVPKGLGLGVIDPTTTLAEDPAEVARVVREAARRRNASEIWLGPGGPLDLLPAEVAARKLRVLPKVERLLAEEKEP